MSRFYRVAGPALIVVAVLLVMHDVVFGGRVTSQHPDLLALWLPTGCSLGDALSGGHIPAWNPFVMGGAPFAADPQSGWLYAPMMSLFSALPCDTAIRWFMVSQPLLGGLGAYAFLRGEQVRRISATTAGITIALLLAGSRLGLSMPLAGAVAWSLVTLAAASRFVHAASAGRRLAWLMVTALCWGQIAGAHLSNGLVLGTLALVAYLVSAWSRDAVDVSRSRYSLWVAALLVALPLVNAAVLLPRASHLPDTSATLGYDLLETEEEASASLPVSWPLTLGRAPGPYLGWWALLFCFGGLWSPRRRRVAAALLALGGLSYLVTLDPVASTIGPLADRVPLGDFYSHRPGRFVYGVVLVLPLLGAMGLDAFFGASPRDRIRLLVPAVAVFVVPALLTGGPGTPLILLVGSVVGLSLLWWVTRHERWAALIPVMVAVEMVATALVGQGLEQAEMSAFNNRAGLAPAQEPELVARDYLTPSPLVSEIKSSGARYISLAPDLFGEEGTIPGYLDSQAPEHWGLLANQRGMLFELGDIQATTSPVQLRRYWSYARAIDPAERRYNATFFTKPLEPVMDLFAVRWIVAREGSGGGAGLFPTASSDGWSLFDRGPRPLATIYGSWDVSTSEAEALDLVTEPGFDQEDDLVVEGDPGFTPTGATGTVNWKEWWPDGPVFDITSDGDALLLVRVPYDDGWHALVDGERVTPVRADYVMQAIPVPAGTHEVELRYDDPAIRYGLVVSALALVILGALAAASLLRARRSTAT